MSKQQANKLANKLAERKTQMTAAERKTADQQVKDYLAKMAPAMAQVLPKHVNPERLARISLSEIRRNPQLLECELPSLMAAVMQAAKLGLEPNILGHCYFVPFNNRKRGVKEVQFIIGYKGLIDLVRRSGHVESIAAHEVYENDEFEFEYGLNEKLRHKPNIFGDRGKVIAYYAYAKFKGGGHSFIVMSREDIEKIRDQFSRSAENGPWKDHFDEMAKKTVIRRLIKYLPISVELQEQIQEDGSVRKDITQEAPEYPDIIDMEPAPALEEGQQSEAEQPQPEQQAEPEQMTLEPEIIDPPLK